MLEEGGLIPPLIAALHSIHREISTSRGVSCASFGRGKIVVCSGKTFRARWGNWAAIHVSVRANHEAQCLVKRSRLDIFRFAPGDFVR
jgi:hypothetical protein